ncbi:MAG: Dabb family protein [Verrucomicrobiota bacterium]
MKMRPVLASLIVILGVLIASVSEANAADAGKKEKPKLRHVVAFKFKASTTPDQIKKVEQAFGELPKKIAQIDKFEWGTNNSPEKHNKGCTHAFILTFKSEKDRDDYLIHPAHKEFGNMVGAYLDDVFVVDFWQKKD